LARVGLVSGKSESQNMPLRNYTEMYREGYADKNNNDLDDRIDCFLEENKFYSYCILPGFIDKNSNGTDDRDECLYLRGRGRGRGRGFRR
jgi:hypothetical protein